MLDTAQINRRGLEESSHGGNRRADKTAFESAWCSHGESPVDASKGSMVGLSALRLAPLGSRKSQGNVRKQPQNDDRLIWPNYASCRDKHR